MQGILECASETEIPKEKKKKSPGREFQDQLMFGVLIWWVTWLSFILGAWLWGSSIHLIEKFGIWDNFQAKIDTPNALAKLANCLQHAIPDRNATIMDISLCLGSMGMRDTPVGHTLE